MERQFLASNAGLEKRTTEIVTCETCGVTMNSETTAQAHFQGKAHAKMLSKLQTSKDEINRPVVSSPPVTPPAKKKKKVESVTCDTCGITMTSQVVADQHYAGIAHKKMIQKLALLTEDTGSSASEERKKKSALYCEVCDVRCPHMNTYEEHMNSQGHKKKVLKRKAEPLEPCKVCNIHFDWPQTMQDHYAGKKHKKKLANLAMHGGNVPGSEEPTTSEQPVPQKKLKTDETGEPGKGSTEEVKSAENGSEDKVKETESRDEGKVEETESRDEGKLEKSSD